MNSYYGINFFFSVTDNSGLRIYYTEESRPQDLATLFIGKRFSSFHFVAPGTVGFQSYGGCSSECTKKVINPATNISTPDAFACPLLSRILILVFFGF